jgi:hypothetical protein
MGGVKVGGLRVFRVLRGFFVAVRGALFVFMAAEMGRNGGGDCL